MDTELLDGNKFQITKQVEVTETYTIDDLDLQASATQIQIDELQARLDEINIKRAKGIEIGAKAQAEIAEIQPTEGVV